MKTRYLLVSLFTLTCLAACSEPEKPEAATPESQAPASVPAPTPATPAAVGPAAESDAVALSEEEVDRAKAEKDELEARAVDLEEQVKDGQMIIDMKAEQIRKLEAELEKLKQAKAQPAK